MPELNSPLKEKVEELLFKKAELDFEKKEYDSCIKNLKTAWELLPDEKIKWNESYLIADYLAAVYVLEKKFDDALNWSTILQKCDLERGDFGEREFALGKVYYEMQDLEKAKEQFIIAMKKSEGRMFEGEDKKYIDLVKKK